MIMDKSPLSPGQSSESKPKKSYHAPEFYTYGDIREITQTIVGGSGMNDSVHGNDKTAP